MAFGALRGSRTMKCNRRWEVRTSVFATNRRRFGGRCPAITSMTSPVGAHARRDDLGSAAGAGCFREAHGAYEVS